MSYDILFVRTGDVADKLAAAREIVDSDSDDDDDGPEPSPEADQRRRRLIADLLKLHPSLRFEAADEGESYGGWIGSDDDACPFPNIELDVDSGMIAISYSADPDALATISPIVEAFAGHGYVAYDPQTDELFGRSETGAAQARFSETRTAVLTRLKDQGETVIHPVVPKPWWKFW